MLTVRSGLSFRWGSWLPHVLDRRNRSGPDQVGCCLLWPSRRAGGVRVQHTALLDLLYHSHTFLFSTLYSSHSLFYVFTCLTSLLVHTLLTRCSFSFSINALYFLSVTLSQHWCSDCYPVTLVAEDGYDPSTSGLWAQHAPAAPLCHPKGRRTAHRDHGRWACLHRINHPH